MPSVEENILLQASPERIWAFITALRYLPLWLLDVESVQAISTYETQAGTTFEIVRARRRGAAEHWIVLDWEQPRSVRFTAYHEKTHLRWRLEPEAAATRLHVQWESSPPRGLLQRLLPATGQRQSLEQSLQRLAELIALNRDIRLLHGMGDE